MTLRSIVSNSFLVLFATEFSLSRAKIFAFYYNVFIAFHVRILVEASSIFMTLACKTATAFIEIRSMHYVKISNLLKVSYFNDVLIVSFLSDLSKKCLFYILRTFIN